ncbi:hypothetical protein [Lederbergia citrea]|uniref:hypothetical protein n=1 Tax=Lederbergia citrea TaxID=2833581 RepID=UPI001BC8D182|nr:hypothetical protein [Lederbergia citrea]MBS4175991.1 hypothetical protein [Lederbergia citrea]MBS4202552.1 hypothetical protein [Lederbergia citrea]
MNIKKMKEKLAKILGSEFTDIFINSEGYQNKVVTFRLKAKKYVARLSDAKRRTKERIELEITLMEYLSDKGIHLAKPVQWNGLDKVIDFEFDLMSLIG